MLTLSTGLYRLLQISPFQNANTLPKICPEVSLEVPLRGGVQHPLSLNLRDVLEFPSLYLETGRSHKKLELDNRCGTQRYSSNRV